MTRLSKQTRRRAVYPYKHPANRSKLKTTSVSSGEKNGYKVHHNAVGHTAVGTTTFIAGNLI